MSDQDYLAGMEHAAQICQKYAAETVSQACAAAALTCVQDIRSNAATMKESATTNDEQKWPHTMDAAAWAKEFCARFDITNRTPCEPERESDGDKEGTMIGWFSNAIMAGYDAAATRFQCFLPHNLPEYTPGGHPVSVTDTVMVEQPLERMQAVGKLVQALRDVTRYGYNVGAMETARRALAEWEKS